MEKVWVFVGEGGRLPSGVFTEDALARDWIRKHRLTGILTAYPVNTGVYEWAIEREIFQPAEARHETPTFVGRFTSASLEHSHFENGVDQLSNDERQSIDSGLSED
jgi:hypothetical protein